MPMRYYTGKYLAECSECQAQGPKTSSLNSAWKTAERVGFWKDSGYSSEVFILCPQCKMKPRCWYDGCKTVVESEEMRCEKHTPRNRCQFINEDGQRCEEIFLENDPFCGEHYFKITWGAIRAEIERLKAAGLWDRPEPDCAEEDRTTLAEIFQGKE